MKYEFYNYNAILYEIAGPAALEDDNSCLHLLIAFYIVIRNPGTTRAPKHQNLL